MKRKANHFVNKEASWKALFEFLFSNVTEGNKNSQQEVVFKLFYLDTKKDFTLQVSIVSKCVLPECLLGENMDEWADI